MPVPKRKTSRANTRSRKAQWLRTEKPTYATCRRCKSPTQPHTVCRICGTYGGRQIVEIEE